MQEAGVSENSGLICRMCIAHGDFLINLDMFARTSKEKFVIW